MRLSWRVLMPLRKASAHVKRLDHYSQFHPTAITMKQYVDFGKAGDQKSSFMFLRKELLVRLANIMKEIQLMPNSLLEKPSAILVQEWYLQSFNDILKYEAITPSTDSMQDFGEVIRQVLQRHVAVVETMAEALMEWKDAEGVDVSTQENVQYFLDRFYLNRISIRMLMSQHLMLFGSELPESPAHIGVIHPDADVGSIVQDAFHNAQFLCDRYYLTAPSLKMEMVNASESEASSPIRVQCVPNHLYHICFELFKNAMRATVESHGEEVDCEDLPPVEVTISKGKEDLSIKISDRGGGVPRSVVKNLFHYMYSSAPRPSSNPGQAPLAGYGYGLPLSRLYAKYFHGDMEITSMEGWGTDAHVYLKARASDAQERVPIYGKRSIARLQNTKKMLDYTERDSTTGHKERPPKAAPDGVDIDARIEL